LKKKDKGKSKVNDKRWEKKAKGNTKSMGEK
jgi:hypothetical protein